MRILKHLLICFLIVLTLNFSLSNIAIAQQFYAEADVPDHSPQSWSTPEIDIPTVEVKKKSRWIWWMLGLAVVAGGAAAAAGVVPEEASGDTGSVDVSW
ncbi:MAG: hypothetical protein JRE28_11585 [Deltaproteobacteria bacterium]|nr:hypothetical protein [Deltaproteobacteria bacterium]